ncbi:MAG: hypothetical protein JXR48_17045 [Candidatus Delongbacteria bacterium]|nr:hypothetical protein [Candidatus Delongbacteria bacterium]MBN2836665.1 hypothetical protein [Candidatus Delongbacteria bacterium]
MKQQSLAITDQKYKDLYESLLTRHNALMESSTQSIVLYYDDNFNLKYWNKGFLTVLEINEEEFQSDYFMTLNGIIKVVINTYQRTLEQEREVVFKTRSGKRVYVHFHIAKTEDNSEFKYVMIGQNFTETRKIYEKLLSRNEELTEKNRIIQESSSYRAMFYNNITHELRTPLSGILGVTGLMKSLPQLDEKVLKNIDIIESNSKNLLFIINQILDISRIDSGKVVPSYTSIPIALLVNDAVNLARSLMQDRDNVEIRKTITPEDAIIRTDYSKMRQVINNLIGNSVKFTESGFIEIIANVDDGYYTISIRDSGIGIAPEVQKKIFEPFVQADGGITKKYGGTGLGLSIAYKLVKLLNGSIELISEPGIGTEFILKFLKKSSDVED